MATKRRNATEKAADKIIERAFYKHSNGVQVPVLNIPKIFEACRPVVLAALASGDLSGTEGGETENRDLDKCMMGAISDYRVKA